MFGKFAIVVGHTQKRPGAKGVAPLNKSEYQYNSELAQVIYRLAREDGIDAKVFTRDKIGLRGAYKQVNSWITEDDIGCCVELHFNAFNGKAKGTETLFDTDPQDSIELSRFVHNEIIDVLGRKGKEDRGLKKVIDGDRGGYNLKLCEVPGCIIEPFFGDNIEDACLGNEMMFEIAAAIVNGIKEYFKQYEYVNSLN